MDGAKWFVATSAADIKQDDGFGGGESLKTMICIMPKKKKVSFRSVWDTHLKPSLLDAKCTTKHVQEMELYLVRWESFWSSSKEPKVQNCEREHLEAWRRNLMELNEYKPRTINKHLGAIRSILVAAAKHGLLKRRPMLEQLPDTTLDPARKIYLRDEQIDKLMLSPSCLRGLSGIDSRVRGFVDRHFSILQGF
jgi:hypothetical protein